VTPTKVESLDAPIEYEESAPALSVFIILATAIMLPVILRHYAKKFFYWREPVLIKEKVVPIFPQVTLYSMQQSRRECYLPRQQRTTWAYYARSYLLTPEDFHLVQFNDIFVRDWKEFKRPRNIWAAVKQVLNMNRLFQRVRTVRHGLGMESSIFTIRDKLGDPHFHVYHHQKQQKEHQRSVARIGVTNHHHKANQQFEIDDQPETEENKKKQTLSVMDGGKAGKK